MATINFGFYSDGTTKTVAGDTSMLHGIISSAQRIVKNGKVNDIARNIESVPAYTCPSQAQMDKLKKWNRVEDNQPTHEKTFGELINCESYDDFVNGLTFIPDKGNSCEQGIILDAEEEYLKIYNSEYDICGYISFDMLKVVSADVVARTVKTFIDRPPVQQSLF